MSKKKKIILIVSILLLVGCTAVFLFNKFHIKSRMLGKITGKIDDWEYHGQASTYNMKSFGSTLSGGLAIDSMKAGATMSDSSSTINSESTIGLSVGGAKDVNNGAEEKKKGSTAVKDGASKVEQGSEEIQSAIDPSLIPDGPVKDYVNGNVELANGSGEVASGASKAMRLYFFNSAEPSSIR